MSGGNTDIGKIFCERSPEKHIIGLDLRDDGGNKYFSFKITDYKKGMKSCHGIVEYYVNYTYPTAKALAKANCFVIPDVRHDCSPAIKKTSFARIEIVNNDAKPDTFNIWFDNIGVGLCVRDVYWHD